MIHGICIAHPQDCSANHPASKNINAEGCRGLSIEFHERGEQNNEADNEKKDRLYKSWWSEQHFDRYYVS